MLDKGYGQKPGFLCLFIPDMSTFDIFSYVSKSSSKIII